MYEKGIPVVDGFSIIVPRENGVIWQKQAGGMSCTQHFLEGIQIPLTPLRHYSEEHGLIDLYRDDEKFQYGMFDHLDDDPRTRWDSSEELWETIREELPFEYEKLSYSEYQDHELSENYPRIQHAIQPVRITEFTGESYQQGIEQFVGEIVFLLAGNAD